MSTIIIDHLSRIIGEQLSSVIFVQDYLQLDFDGNTLTCYKWPTVSIEGKLYSFGDIEYRNMLCQFIASIVIKVNSTSTEILIEFINGVIVFTMHDEEEVLYFNDKNNKWSFYPLRNEI